VVLVTSLSKKKAKFVKAALEVNKVQFDAIYISKMPLVSYELIYKDFGITENASERALV
jgi:hypothetical protein